MFKWAKNVLQSSSYILKTVAKGTPLNEIYEDIKSTKDEITDLIRETDFKEEKEFAGDIKKELAKGGANAISSVLSGKLFDSKRQAKSDKERQDSLFKDMGMDLNFLDDIDFGDDSSKKGKIPNIIDNKNVTNTVVAPMINVSSEGRSSKAEGKKNKAIFQASVLTVTAINTTNTILSSMMEFHKNETAKFYENTSKFYTEMSEKFTSLLTSKKEFENEFKVIIDVAKDYSKKYSTDQPHFSPNTDPLAHGNLDLGKYKNTLKKNLFNVIPELGMLRDILESPENKKMLIGELAEKMANPIASGLTMAITNSIPTILKNSMDFLKDTVGSVGRNFIMMMNDLASSSDPILSTIGGLFGFKKSSPSLNTSDYTKGAVEFDGITRKNITYVIPTLLGKILAVNTALYHAYVGVNKVKSADLDNYNVFNSESGRFEKSRAIEAEIDDAKSSIGYRLEGTKNKILGSESLKDLKPEEKAYLDAKVSEGLSNIIKSGRIVTGNESEGEFASKTGLASEDRNASEAIRKYIASLSSQGKNEFGLELYKQNKSRDYFLGNQYENVDRANLLIEGSSGSDIRKKNLDSSFSGLSAKRRNAYDRAVSSASFNKISETQSGQENGGMVDMSANFLDNISNTINQLFFGSEGVKGIGSEEGIFGSISGFFDFGSNIVFGAKVKDTDGIMDRLQNRFKSWVVEPLGNYFNETISPLLNKLFFDPKDGIVNTTSDMFKSSLSSFKKWWFGPDVDDETPFSTLVSKQFKDELINPLRDGFKSIYESIMGTDIAGSIASIKKFASDNEFGIKSTGVGIISSFFLPGGPILGGLLGFAYSTNTVQETLYGKVNDKGELEGGLISKETGDKLKKAGIDGAKGYIIGSLLGGPVIGGFLGLAHSTDTVQEYLYGTYNKEGKQVTEGILGNDYKKKLKSLGINVGSGYVIGSLLGGPVIGGLLGLAHSTDTVQEYLYGEGQLLDTAKAKLSEVKTAVSEMIWGTGKESLGEDGKAIKDKGFLGFAKEKFGLLTKDVSQYLFGEYDEKEKKRKGGILSKVSDIVVDDIWKPLTKGIEDSLTGVKTFFQQEIIKPLKDFWDPLMVEAKYQTDKFFNWTKSLFTDIGSATADAVGEAMGVDLVQVLRENVVDPLKKMLTTLKEGITGIFKQILLFPINLIRQATKSLQERHKNNLNIFGKFSKKTDSTVSEVKGTDVSAEEAKQWERSSGGGEGEDGMVAKVTSKTTSVETARDSAKAASGTEVSADSEAAAAVEKAAGEEKTMSQKLQEKVTDIGGTLKDLGSAILDKGLGFWESMSKSLTVVSDKVTSPEDIAKKNSLFGGSDVSGAIVDTSNIVSQINEVTVDQYNTAVDMMGYLKNIDENTYALASAGGKVDGSGKEGKSTLFGFLTRPLRKNSIFGKIWDVISWPVTKAKDLIGNIFSTGWKIISEPFRHIGTIIEKTSTALQTVLDTVKDTVHSISNIVETTTRSVFTIITDISSSIKEAAKETIRIAGSLFRPLTRLVFSVSEFIMKSLGSLGGMLNLTFRSLATGLGLTSDAISPFIKKFSEGLGSFFGGIGSGLGTLFSLPGKIMARFRKKNLVDIETINPDAIMRVNIIDSDTSGIPVYIVEKPGKTPEVNPSNPVTDGKPADDVTKKERKSSKPVSNVVTPGVIPLGYDGPANDDVNTRSEIKAEAANNRVTETLETLAESSEETAKNTSIISRLFGKDSILGKIGGMIWAAGGAILSFLGAGVSAVGGAIGGLFAGGTAGVAGGAAAGGLTAAIPSLAAMISTAAITLFGAVFGVGLTIHDFAQSYARGDDGVDMLGNALLGSTGSGGFLNRLSNSFKQALKWGSFGAILAAPFGATIPMGFGIGALLGGLGGFIGKDFVSEPMRAIGSIVSSGLSGVVNVFKNISGFIAERIGLSIEQAFKTGEIMWDTSSGIWSLPAWFFGFGAGAIGGLFGYEDVASMLDGPTVDLGIVSTLSSIGSKISSWFSFAHNQGVNIFNTTYDASTGVAGGFIGGIFGGMAGGLGYLIGLGAGLFGIDIPDTFVKIGPAIDSVYTHVGEMFSNFISTITYPFRNAHLQATATADTVGAGKTGIFGGIYRAVGFFAGLAGGFFGYDINSSIQNLVKSGNSIEAAMFTAVHTFVTDMGNGIVNFVWGMFTSFRDYVFPIAEDLQELKKLWDEGSYTELAAFVTKRAAVATIKAGGSLIKGTAMTVAGGLRDVSGAIFYENAEETEYGEKEKELKALKNELTSNLAQEAKAMILKDHPNYSEYPEDKKKEIFEKYKKIVYNSRLEKQRARKGWNSKDLAKIDIQDKTSKNSVPLAIKEAYGPDFDKFSQVEKQFIVQEFKTNLGSNKSIEELKNQTAEKMTVFASKEYKEAKRQKEILAKAQIGYDPAKAKLSTSDMSMEMQLAVKFPNYQSLTGEEKKEFTRIYRKEKAKDIELQKKQNDLNIEKTAAEEKNLGLKPVSSTVDEDKKEAEVAESKKSNTSGIVSSIQSLFNTPEARARMEKLKSRFANSSLINTQQMPSVTGTNQSYSGSSSPSVQTNNAELKSKFNYTGVDLKNNAKNSKGSIPPASSVYLSQKDPEWASHPYSITGDPSQNIKTSGCGITSMAMVSKYYGQPGHPKDFANLAIKKGYRTRNSGTSDEFFRYVAGLQGLDITATGTNYNAIQEKLNQGMPVIASVRSPSKFTGGPGHFIMLHPAQKPDEVIVNDPNHPDRSKIYKLKSVGTIKRSFAFSKDGKGLDKFSIAQKTQNDVMEGSPPGGVLEGSPSSSGKLLSGVTSPLLADAMGFPKTSQPAATYNKVSQTPSVPSPEAKVEYAGFSKFDKEIQSTKDSAIAYKSSQESLLSKDSSDFKTITDYLKMIAENTRITAEKDTNVTVNANGSNQSSGNGTDRNLSNDKKAKVNNAVNSAKKNSGTNTWNSSEVLPPSVEIIAQGSTVDVSM